MYNAATPERPTPVPIPVTPPVISPLFSPLLSNIKQEPLALDVLNTRLHSQPLEAGYTYNTLHSTSLELKIQLPESLPPFYVNCIYLNFDRLVQHFACEQV